MCGRIISWLGCHLKDGHSNWFKGVQLVMVYIIIATMFYFLPELH
jgi:Ca2+/H+ antiporter